MTAGVGEPPTSSRPFKASLNLRAIQASLRAVKPVPQVVLNTGSCVDDQGLGLLRGLADAHIDLPVTWLVDSPCAAACYKSLRINERYPKVTLLGRRTPEGLLAFLRAKYVFFTHGLFASAQPPSNRVTVNMWHGMPFKTIGGTQVGATYTLSTSENWSTHIASAFQQPLDSVLPFGLPRNDALFETVHSDSVRARLGTQDRRLVVWLPTFRRTKFHGSPTDGVELNTPFNLAGASIDSVASMARRLGAQVVLKTHPYAVDQTEHSSNDLHVMTTESLHRRGISLYQLIGAADTLITDYSSVWIDFLLTRKPLIFVTGDIETYGESRGFTLSPPTEWLPGPRARSLRQIAEHLASMDSGAYSDERAAALSWHHSYPDGLASRRLIERVFE